MKVTLVVAAGVHEGKTIPITAMRFVIGRDPQCQLRPASQAVSKQHCAVIIKDDVVSIEDFGSTNGTIINDELVRGEERVISNNDRVKVGPLDFTVRIEAGTILRAPGTAPTEAIRQKADEALAAVRAVAEPATVGASSNPISGASKPKPDSKASPASPPKGKQGEPNNDEIAAMLLGMGDDESAKVPEGSTVMEVPVPPMPGSGNATAAPGKKVATREDTSNAASEILRKMRQRSR